MNSIIKPEWNIITRIEVPGLYITSDKDLPKYTICNVIRDEIKKPIKLISCYIINYNGDGFSYEKEIDNKVRAIFYMINCKAFSIHYFTSYEKLNALNLYYYGDQSKFIFMHKIQITEESDVSIIRPKTR